MKETLRNVIVALAAIAILGGVIWHFIPPKEPIYKGKPLTYWLSGYGFPKGTNNMGQARLDAKLAVEALGTNCIPTLLAMIDEPESSTRKRLIGWVNYVGRKRHWNSWKLEYPNPYEKSTEAWNAFQVLGPQRSDLLTDLTKIYDRNANRSTRQFALAMATVVSTNSKEMMPLITRSLADTNDMFLRADAVVALVHIHAPPEVAVPVLMKALKDSNDGVRVLAIYGLGEYGADAKSALPEMQKILDDAEAEGKTSTSWLAFGFCFGNAEFYRTNKMAPLASSSDVAHAAEDAIPKIKAAESNQDAKVLRDHSVNEP